MNRSIVIDLGAARKYLRADYFHHLLVQSTIFNTFIMISTNCFCKFEEKAYKKSYRISCYSLFLNCKFLKYGIFRFVRPMCLRICNIDHDVANSIVLSRPQQPLAVFTQRFLTVLLTEKA